MAEIESISDHNPTHDEPKSESIPRSFSIACDTDILSDNWTVILKRQNGSVNFHRNWQDYKNGFGNRSGEFFIGLDKIHALTADASQELIVLLEDFTGSKAYESYDKFVIANEEEGYALKTLGNAKGTAGDSLCIHVGAKFTTHDNNNDFVQGNSAQTFTGAWWYNAGYLESHLTGTYNDNSGGKGVIWETFRPYEYSLKRAIMLIRSKRPAFKGASKI